MDECHSQHFFLVPWPFLNVKPLVLNFQPPATTTPSSQNETVAVKQEKTVSVPRKWKDFCGKAMCCSLGCLSTSSFVGKWMEVEKRPRGKRELVDRL